MKKDSWHVRLYFHFLKNYPRTMCEYRRNWIIILFVLLIALITLLLIVSYFIELYCFIMDGSKIFSMKYRSFINAHVSFIFVSCIGIFYIICILLYKLISKIKIKQCEPIKWE